MVLAIGVVRKGRSGEEYLLKRLSNRHVDNILKDWVQGRLNNGDDLPVFVILVNQRNVSLSFCLVTQALGILGPGSFGHVRNMREVQCDGSFNHRLLGCNRRCEESV